MLTNFEWDVFELSYLFFNRSQNQFYFQRLKRFHQATL